MTVPFQLTRAGSGACSCKAEEGADALGVPPARAQPSVGESATDDNAADARAGPRDPRQDPKDRHWMREGGTGPVMEP
ncbi:hypothetical protein GCM10009601_19890 [Streptomyces thermospinosisporus]|uniref:Uncharacterized protein n=1 Tax=Streptomyces thermospinosisporus TaxID=161482 RepID=A0ABN1YRI9_9ACTN